MIRLFNIFILSAIFFGCVDNKTTEKNIDTQLLKYNYSFDNNIWKSNDVLGFNVDIEDTSLTYYNKVSICHTNEFMYQNLIMLVYHIYNQDTVNLDTLDILLARNDGKWLGYGDSYKEVEYIYRSNLGHYKGNHRFEMELAMRSYDLTCLSEIEGVTNIGLSVQNNNEVVLDSNLLTLEKFSNGYYIQKPIALVKLNELDSKRVLHLDENKFSISHSKSGKINYAQKEDEISIFNIEYKDYDIDISFKFRTVSNITLEILHFEREMEVHENQGAYIDVNIIENDHDNIYGLLCYLDGYSIATSSQFFLTDSNNFFVSGGIELNSPLSNDFIPQNKIMKEEIKKIIESFRWAY